jgi:predicted small secreted protein
VPPELPAPGRRYLTGPSRIGFPRLEEKPMTARILLIAGLMAAGLGMAACENTVRGVGQDTQKAGQGIQQSVPPERQTQPMQ